MNEDSQQVIPDFVPVVFRGSATGTAVNADRSTRLFVFNAGMAHWHSNVSTPAVKSVHSAGRAIDDRTDTLCKSPRSTSLALGTTIRSIARTWLYDRTEWP